MLQCFFLRVDQPRKPGSIVLQVSDSICSFADPACPEPAVLRAVNPGLRRVRISHWGDPRKREPRDYNRSPCAPACAGATNLTVRRIYLQPAAPA